MYNETHLILFLYMLWLKALHIISVITWFAGLFYLPRLFVYHSICNDNISIERFKIMEAKLYNYIMMPSLVVSTLLGGAMAINNWDVYSSQYWFWLKLLLVLDLIAYHFYCGHLIKLFKNNNNSHGFTFYSFFNEFPTIILLAVVILVVVKPF